jgi:hypothetical protein
MSKDYSKWLLSVCSLMTQFILSSLIVSLYNDCDLSSAFSQYISIDLSKFLRIRIILFTQTADTFKFNIVIEVQLWIRACAFVCLCVECGFSLDCSPGKGVSKDSFAHRDPCVGLPEPEEEEVG